MKGFEHEKACSIIRGVIIAVDERICGVLSGILLSVWL